MTLHTFTPAAALILTCGLTWLAQPCAAQRGSAPVRAQPTTARMATSYPFPARADELKPGEYWYRLKKTHGAGWKLGYDLDAIRHDSMEEGWTRYYPGIDPKAKWGDTKNSDWIVHGKRVYAIADGEVSGCWRNAPENPTPGSRHPSSESIPGEGNHLWVEQSDGLSTLYAHFQPGSVPTALCPLSDTLTMRGDSDQTKMPEDSLPQVRRDRQILRGFQKALEHLDEVIQLVLQSKSPSDARKALMDRFEIVERQAQAITELQLQRLTGMERQNILDLLAEIQQKRAATKLPVGSRPKVKRGQYLGRVGNSGNSSNPHLHIHMEEDGQRPLPIHGVAVTGIDSNSEEPLKWTRIEGEVLPPGPIAILPN